MHNERMYIKSSPISLSPLAFRWSQCIDARVGLTPPVPAAFMVMDLILASHQLSDLIKHHFKCFASGIHISAPSPSKTLYIPSAH